jgi:hypothetical protein
MCWIPFSKICPPYINVGFKPTKKKHFILGISITTLPWINTLTKENILANFSTLELSALTCKVCEVCYNKAWFSQKIKYKHGDVIWVKQTIKKLISKAWLHSQFLKHTCIWYPVWNKLPGLPLLHSRISHLLVYSEWKCKSILQWRTHYQNKSLECCISHGPWCFFIVDTHHL